MRVVEGKKVTKRAKTILGILIGAGLLSLIGTISVPAVILCGMGPRFITSGYDEAQNTNEIYVETMCIFRRRIHLTENIDGNASTSSAAWSPDRKQIVFVVSDKESHNRDIFVVTSNGREHRQLTRNQGRNLRPDWSPDGSRLAFESDRDGNKEIYVMNADGSDQINLTNDKADDTEPSWAPEGIDTVFRPNAADDYIAFTTNRGGDSEVYVMNVADRSVANLTNDSEKEDRIVDWLDDGSVVFDSVPVGDSLGGTGMMTIIYADGTKEKVSGRLRDPQLSNPFWWWAGKRRE
jgi:Tol biopolymer transport system component